MKRHEAIKWTVNVVGKWINPSTGETKAEMMEGEFKGTWEELKEGMNNEEMAKYENSKRIPGNDKGKQMELFN